MKSIKNKIVDYVIWILEFPIYDPKYINMQNLIEFEEELKQGSSM